MTRKQTYSYKRKREKIRYNKLKAVLNAWEYYKYANAYKFVLLLSHSSNTFINNAI